MSGHTTPALAAFFRGEPIKPIGFLPSGRAVFPIAGGAPDPEPDPAPEPKPDPAPEPSAYKPPATQDDLNRIIGERVAREREKFADYATIKAKADEHDKILAANQTEHEKALAAAKDEGKNEVLTATNARLVSAEARALAAEVQFASPALVVKTLDLSDIKVNDDGTVDAEAIKTKLAEAKESGAFVMKDAKPGRPKPDPAQGGGGKKGNKLTGLGGSELYDRLHPKTA